MATQYIPMNDFSGAKTYATKANVVKAVEKMFPESNNDGLRYMIMVGDDGRFFPVFIGESALRAGVHFHFHVVA